MNILMINGSPRRGKANSRVILDEIRKRLGEGHAYRMIEPMVTTTATKADFEVDLIIIAFPLYIDCLHSQLLRWLISAEQLLAGTQGPTATRRPAMIAIANNGFYEGVQNRGALDILVNFCARTGIEWRGGAGIGSGEMMLHLRDAPDTMFIKLPVSRLLDDMASLAAAVESETPAREPPPHRFATHNFPWLVYKFMGHAGWKKQGRDNGLKARALFAQPFEEG